VLWTGTAIFVALAISVANDIAGEPLGPVPTWVLWGVFAALPIAVLAVLLQRRLARGAVADLVVDIGIRTEPVDLQAALGRALGDSSLQLAYWVPATGRFVDADGSAVTVSGPGEARVATLVQRDGETVAALIHDPALLENPELVDSACAAAALSLDNERLRAELLARLAELQASRARLVEATDRERRRIERDLHDGTQQRLVSVAMTLALAESRLARDGSSVEPVVREAKQALTAALEELRRLTQGIRPAILIERGLAAALDDLTRRSPLLVRSEVETNGTLPESIEEAAYYVASEALSNVVKHSQASNVRLAAWREDTMLVVEVADDGIGGAHAGDGSGLRGLADRVEALGGRFSIASPPGGGTRVRAAIPCA
jgi:signal transduction histidine kinase